MPIKKLWNYVIKIKKGFVLIKGKVYLLLREKRGEIFFIEKKDCYNLGLELSERHTLILSNTRELDRVPKYKSSTLYTNYWWSMLYSFSPTLMTMCLPWG